MVITGNYAQLYFTYFDQELGIAWLDGKTAQEAMFPLDNAIQVLGVERDDDYWAATPGNAGYALAVLRAWALEHPGAVFKVS
jgi:hypothetical protein